MTVGVIIQLPVFIIFHTNLLQVADNAGFIFYCISKYCNQSVFGTSPPLFLPGLVQILNRHFSYVRSKATFFLLFHLYPSFSWLQPWYQWKYIFSHS